MSDNDIEFRRMLADERKARWVTGFLGDILWGALVGAFFFIVAAMLAA